MSETTFEHGVHVTKRGWEESPARPVYSVGWNDGDARLLVANDLGVLATVWYFDARPCVFRCPVEGCTKGASDRDFHPTTEERAERNAEQIRLRGRDSCPCGWCSARIDAWQRQCPNCGADLTDPDLSGAAVAHVG